jgi:O-antigen/teichoic acid export membrane protein
MRWSTLASVPLAGWFVAGGPLIVDIVYGPSFHRMAVVVIIVAFAAVVTAFGSVGGSAAYATHRHSSILLIQGGCAIMNVILAVLLCRRYGAIGAAYAGTIAQGVGAAMGVGFILRVAKLNPPWSPIIRTVVAGTVATAAGLAARWLLSSALPSAIVLAVVSAVFFATFVAMLVATQAVPADETAAILSSVRHAGRSVKTRIKRSTQVHVQ